MTPVVLTLGAGVASADAASGRPITPNGETPPKEPPVTDRPSGNPAEQAPTIDGSAEERTTTAVSAAATDGSASAASARSAELAYTGADVGSIMAVGAVATAAGAALIVAARERSAEVPDS